MKISETNIGQCLSSDIPSNSDFLVFTSILKSSFKKICIYRFLFLSVYVCKYVCIYSTTLALRATSVKLL